jgi:hypothetical protein
MYKQLRAWEDLPLLVKEFWHEFGVSRHPPEG